MLARLDVSLVPEYSFLSLLAKPVAAPLNLWVADDAEAFMSRQVCWTNDWITEFPLPGKQVLLWHKFALVLRYLEKHARWTIYLPFWMPQCACVFPTMHYNYDCRDHGICWQTAHPSWMWSELLLDCDRKLLNPVNLFLLIVIEFLILLKLIKFLRLNEITLDFLDCACWMWLQNSMLNFAPFCFP